jgi:hypothetical protein
MNRGVSLSIRGAITESDGRYQNTGHQPDPDHPNNPQPNLFLVACRHAPAWYIARKRAFLLTQLRFSARLKSVFSPS